MSDFEMRLLQVLEDIRDSVVALTVATYETREHLDDDGGEHASHALEVAMHEALRHYGDVSREEYLEAWPE